jgi:hypothetical protein
MWQLIDKTEKIVAGVPYRSTFKWRIPYTAELASLAVSAAWAARVPLGLVGIKLDGVSASPPSQTPQAPGSRYLAWMIRVTWRRK